MICKFDRYLIDLSSLPWDLILDISLISLMNEFRKYIVIFGLVSFLGFNKKFAEKFEIFTNLITSLIKIICLLHLFVVFVRDLISIISKIK